MFTLAGKRTMGAFTGPRKGLCGSGGNMCYFTGQSVAHKCQCTEEFTEIRPEQ